MKYLLLLFAGLLTACAAHAGSFANSNEAFRAELGYSVALYDETRDCVDSYYAERTEGADTKAGCWIALDDGSGGVIITALYTGDLFEVYLPEHFDVLHDPQWDGGPYAEPEVEETPSE